MKPSPAVTSGSELSAGARAVLGQAQSSRTVIQNFCPLSDSIEWQLGQRYLHERGTQAFLGDAHPVPYVVNNDGILSRNAAEVFFINLAAAELAGRLDAQIFALELGIGVGLFARYFLDTFRDLCLQHGKDYYDRLCYIAADRSEPMLRDAGRQGVLAHHPGRYVLRVVDALDPERTLADDLLFAGQDRPLHAVFLNYLLDCLPATVLEVDAREVRQLCVRTCLARGVNLADHTPLTAEELAQRAASPDPQHQRELLPVYGLLASEYDYQPVVVEQMPYGSFAVAFARTRVQRVLHNYGAIQCLERLVGMLREDGFILLNDYGQTQLNAAEEYEHQRFSHATFIGINFPLLKAYFTELRQATWVEPPGESASIHSRLLGHAPAMETVVRFQQRFDKAHHDWLQQPLERARELSKTGRFEAAATSYRQALERQPNNWVLMNEIAMFLTFSLRDARAGADLAKLALALNPISAELWNTLGDCLFEWGRTEEAARAYLRAERLNPSDVRARYNLAWVHARLKDYPAALQKIAEALALDPTGDYRERLLNKQAEVLAALAQRRQQEYLRLANRVSTTASPLSPASPHDHRDSKAAPATPERPSDSGSTPRDPRAAPPSPPFTPNRGPS